MTCEISGGTLEIRDVILESPNGEVVIWKDGQPQFGVVRGLEIVNYRRSNIGGF